MLLAENGQAHFLHVELMLIVGAWIDRTRGSIQGSWPREILPALLIFGIFSVFAHCHYSPYSSQRGNVVICLPELCYIT